MKIKVVVKANSNINSLTKLQEREYLVHVTQKPVHNRANVGVIKLLSKFFDEVKLLAGHSSKIKFFSVTNKNK